MKSRVCASPGGVRKEMKPASKLRFKGLAKGDEGYILIMSLFVLLILSLIGLGLAVVSINEFNLSARTKLMDEAYVIADAGVNRMTIEMQANPAWTSGTPLVSPGNIYLAAGATAQSHLPNESFAGGTYDVYLWQSEAFPLDPTYKVIVSTGKITRSGKTSERSIETRIIAGAGHSKDYDASFDYLIYNGMDSDGDGVGDTDAIWEPGDLGYITGTIPLGSFVWDGGTPDEVTGRSPKGAVYTRGSIKVPTSLFGDAKFLGNIVATDDITLQNAWAVHAAAGGIVVGGPGITSNVIAGLDNSGTAYINTTAVGGFATAIEVFGNVDAGTDVNVQSVATIGFLRPCQINGIKAGRDVNIKGTANISKDMNVGNIVSGRRTDVDSRWLTGITIGTIFAGQDLDGVGDGVGVDLDTAAASSILASNIVSRGEVKAVADLAGIVLGTVTCGNNTSGDLGGTGLYFDMDWASGCSAGQVKSTGLVDLRATRISTISTGGIWAGTNNTSGVGGNGITWSGTVLSTINVDTWSGSGGANDRSATARGNITANMASGSHITTTRGMWSGSNIDLNGGEWVGFDDNIVIGGAVLAEGHVNLTTGDNVTVNGSVTSEQWVKIWSIASVLSGNNDININGNIYAGSAVIPDFVWYANGIPMWPNPTAPDRTESGWTVYVNNSNDIPAFSDNLNITGAISSVGNVTVLGQDTIQTGAIASNGNVRISHNYDWIGNSSNYILGSITAGGYIDIYSDVELTGGDDSIHTSSLSAVGEIKVQGHDPIVTDSILSNSNVKIRSTWKDITCGNYIQNNGSIQCGGYLDWYGCAVNLEPNSWISGGVWAAGNVTIKRSDAVDASDTDLTIGYIGGSDCVRTRGYLRMEGAGDIGYEDIKCPNEDFWGNSDGDLRHGTGNSLDDVTYRDLYGGYASSPPTYTHSSVGTPSVATPTIPAKPTAPTVGHSAPPRDVDLLSEAGLEATVNILSPNWTYFYNAAQADDSSNPGAAHVVYDGGAGDDDHEINGYVSLVWDVTSPYSTNETVYCPDPNVDIRIKSLNWAGRANYFQGTIVSRKDLYLTNNATTWFVGGTQVINCVAGHDVVAGSTGLALVQTIDSEFHFWAGHDILLNNQKIALISVTTFEGSFTACNKVTYNSGTLFDKTTFKWSRWALDPAAWVPPFQLLNWREIY